MNIKSKKGFTIIEVVLVLAIAGLIFLMVFIALPTMQRNQRDTQRRNDYSMLSSAMTNYMTNNNGKLPTTLGNDAAKKYINDSGEDPNGFQYKLSVVKCTTDGNAPSGTDKECPNTKNKLSNATADEASIVYVVTNAGCDSGTPVFKSSSRAFAIYGNLESGNGTYCQASS